MRFFHGNPNRSVIRYESSRYLQALHFLKSRDNRQQHTSTQSDIRVFLYERVKLKRNTKILLQTQETLKRSFSANFVSTNKREENGDLDKLHCARDDKIFLQALRYYVNLERFPFDVDKSTRSVTH